MRKEKVLGRFDSFFEKLAPFGDLLIRIIVAKIFFESGILKVQSWTTTVMLFQSEYSVPFLSAPIAAALAAMVEIVFSLFLFLGLFDRIPAIILFVFNIAAVLFYPYLWTEAGYVGLKDHFYWGLLLLFLSLHGPGKFSVDQLWRNKLSSK